jgi:hypothetical protein
MGFLGDALGMAGSAISAPGDYTRGALAGKFGERMGGRDLLRHYGLADQEDTWGNFLGGMAADVLTDPLTYAGAFLGGAGGGAAAKGLRGMIPLVAEDAAGAGAEAIGGLAKFKEPLRDVAVIKNLRPTAAEVAGLPGTLPFSGEMSGRTASSIGAGDVRNRMARMAQEGLGEALPEFQGGYHSNTGTMFNTPGMSPAEGAKTLRHERVHAIIDQASKGAGDVEQLPALMRYPAKLKAMDSPLAQSSGIIGDELAAQALENRTTAGQLKGAAGFLFHPERNAAYAGQFAAAGLDPRAVGLYRYLPQGVVHAGQGLGAAGGASANYLLQALMGGGSE